MFNSAIGENFQPKECKHDYEEQAARLKRSIDANKKCLEGMIVGIQNGAIDLNFDQRILYYAIIGSLTVKLPEMENNYFYLLKKIENN